MFYPDTFRPPKNSETSPDRCVQSNKKSRTSKWWIKCWVPYQETLCSANVFEWSRRVEKLYVVQEINWPYLYVAFHSMHTLWSSIHDSSSGSLSVFTVRSYMFMKINIYLMFIFIYIIFIYIIFIYVYENKHIWPPEHSVKSFFENRMKIQDKKTHWEMEGLQC